MQLTGTGGLLGKKSEPVEAAQHPTTKATFVKMTKSQRWLQRMGAGCVQNCCLNSTTLLDSLIDKMMAAGDQGDGPAAEDDPMHDLDYDDHGDGPADAEASAAPVPKKRLVMNTVVRITMPEVCPTATAGASDRLHSEQLSLACSHSRHARGGANSIKEGAGDTEPHRDAPGHQGSRR